MIVLAAIVMAVRVIGGTLTWNRWMTMTLLVLLLTTAVFDSLIVGSEIVAYDPNQLLGVYVGAAPIEDFFYAVAAVVIVPNVWHIVHKEHHRAEA